MDWLQMVAKAVGYAIAIIILTEIAKRNAFISSVIIAFPIMTALVVASLHVETGDAARSYKMASTTFWLILASLSFFIVLAVGNKFNWNFWLSFGLAVVTTIASIIGFTLVLKKFGINLLSNV